MSPVVISINSRKIFSKRAFLAGGAGLLGSVIIESLLAEAAVKNASIVDNPIRIENRKRGTNDWELTNPAQNREIEGYASLTSVARGGRIHFFVSTREPRYIIEIFRMGWYGGAGGRRMTAPEMRTGHRQVVPKPDESTGVVECEWIDPFVLNVPDTRDPTEWASGIYLAKLTSEGEKKQSYIIFVVRDDTRASGLIVQSSVTTFQAYNNWGGKSLYNWNSKGERAAKKVSFNRPYAASPNPIAARGVGAGEFLTNVQRTIPAASWEYNMVRFLERVGYDVVYCSDVDTHLNSSLLLGHKGCIFMGHDEYWSWERRENVERARNAGIHLGFFTANACYWQVRYEADRTGPSRSIVCYKHEAPREDPLALDNDDSNDHLLTNLWRKNPRKPPEDALVGVMYIANPVYGDIIVRDANHWVCGGTGLHAGDRLQGLLGYEVDCMQGHAPLGTSLIAHSPFDNGGGLRYSDMTIYQAPSGAFVFATGSMQWAWGLDDYGAPRLRPSLSSRPAIQMTRNVLARFLA